MYCSTLPLRLLTSGAVLAGALSAQTFPEFTWETRTPQQRGFNPTLFQGAMDRLPSPAIVVKDGYVVGEKGDVTRPGFTLSGSKSLVALIAGRLMYQGRFEYDTVVPRSDVPARPLASYRHFLSMTSDYNLSPHSPGSHYAYNNHAMSYLADYLNDAYFPGDSKVSMLRKAYLDRLGHEDPIDFRGTGSGWGVGGWSLSARDMARVGLWVLSYGEWKGERLIAREFIERLYECQIPAEATEGGPGESDFDNQVEVTRSLPGCYSFGFWLPQCPNGFAGGVSNYVAASISGAYGTSMHVVPSLGLVIAAVNTVDSQTGGKIPGDAINDFARALESPSAPEPDPRPEPAQRVTRCSLVNADTNLTLVDALEDGAVLNYAALPTRNLNIVAVAEPAAIGSIEFKLNGALQQVENVSPYALAGDSRGDYAAWQPAPGSYTLTATPFSQPDRGGTVGGALTIRFTVQEGSADGVAAVVGFTLIDAATDHPVPGIKLADGAVLRLSQLPRDLNIRADVNRTTSSAVEFTLDGAPVRMERVAPYAIAGDVNGDYAPWRPSPGAHKLAARVDAAGSTPYVISFSVTE